jgi:hypothetical protein
MPKYYLYYAWAGDERIKPMQARSRAEALEELRRRWSEMSADNRSRMTAYLAIEVRGAVDIPADEVAWESPDMCSKRWMVTAYGEHGLADCHELYDSYQAAADAAEVDFNTHHKVEVSAWSATHYEWLYTLEA